MSTDYSKSKFENEIAERAFEAILDGGSEETIHDEEGVLYFDLVEIEEGLVILRYDSQGFVWVEYGPEQRSLAHNLFRHWGYLKREYEREEEEID